MYEDGSYLSNNPTWHVEDSLFKAGEIYKMMVRNQISPSSIAEVGCGTGAVVARLSDMLDGEGIEYRGYDIATEAIRLASDDTIQRVHLNACDMFETNEYADLLLVVDVFEHVPDYMQFLRNCRNHAKELIYHIPLDVHVSSVVRGSVTKARRNVGHLHYFTAESALATLEDTGHHIADLAYTPTAFHSVKVNPTFACVSANVPRWLVSRLSSGVAARLFGGFSLLVYTQ